MANAPINRNRINDSWGELIGKMYYRDYVTLCAKCGNEFLFTGGAQKYVLEIRRVPVSKIEQNTLCKKCHLKRVNRREKKQILQVSNPRATANKALVGYYTGTTGLSGLMDHVEIMVADLGEYLSYSSLEKLLKKLIIIRRGEPEWIEIDYWEGRIYEMMGRARTAKNQYLKFLSTHQRGKRLNYVRKDAKQRVRKLS